MLSRSVCQQCDGYRACEFDMALGKYIPLDAENNWMCDGCIVNVQDSPHDQGCPFFLEHIMDLQVPDRDRLLV
jgi:hypothetical protein